MIIFLNINTCESHAMAFIKHFTDEIFRLSDNYDSKIKKMEKFMKVLRGYPTQNMHKCSEVDNFIHSCKPLHLRIEDIEKWEPGKTYEVAMFHRNYDDYIVNANVELDKYMYPEELCLPVKEKIIYLGDMEIQKRAHPYITERRIYKFELDVSNINSRWVWYPLNKDNKVVIQGHPDLPPESSWDFEAFPKDTRVGWRGPMMLWEDLKHLPQIYINDDATFHT